MAKKKKNKKKKSKKSKKTRKKKSKKIIRSRKIKRTKSRKKKSKSRKSKPRKRNFKAPKILEDGDGKSLIKVSDSWANHAYVNESKYQLKYLFLIRMHGLMAQLTQEMLQSETLLSMWRM